MVKQEPWAGGIVNNVQMEVSTSHGRRPGIFPCAEISRAGERGRDRMSESQEGILWDGYRMNGKFM